MTAAMSSRGTWSISLRSPSVDCTTMKPREAKRCLRSSATSTMRPIMVLCLEAWVANAPDGGDGHAAAFGFLEADRFFYGVSECIGFVSGSGALVGFVVL